MSQKHSAKNFPKDVSLENIFGKKKDQINQYKKDCWIQ